jgi:hypothetical protein
MARQKRQHLLLLSARTYLSRRMPELENQPLRLRALDGPPGSPRYSVTVEVCSAGACPHGVPAQLARAGQCPVDICPLRRCVRLLLDRRGTVLQETESTAHWS